MHELAKVLEFAKGHVEEMQCKFLIRRYPLFQTKLTRNKQAELDITIAGVATPSHFLTPASIIAI